MSLVDQSRYRQAAGTTMPGGPRISPVVNKQSLVSLYLMAPGVEPVRIRTMRHHQRRIVGMYALQPVPEIPLSYADFLHLGPVSAAIEPVPTDVLALLPARVLQLV